MSQDALDKAIETKRREVSDAREKLHALELELRTLEFAAQLRPGFSERTEHAARPITRAGSDSRRGGRQPGAISGKWRRILGMVAVSHPEGAKPEDIASLGPEVGLPNLSARDVRQRAKEYISHGYFEQIGDSDLYKVTEAACERFGLRTAAGNEPSFNPTMADSEESEAPFTLDARMAAE